MCIDFEMFKRRVMFFCQNGSDYEEARREWVNSHVIVEEVKTEKSPLVEESEKDTLTQKSKESKFVDVPLNDE